MEKKKLLLVAVTVGVFLVIVVSAAILVFRPASAPPAAASVSGAPAVSAAPLSPAAASVPVPPVPGHSASTDLEAFKDDAYRGLQNPAAVSPIQKNDINIYGESTVIVDGKDQNGASRTISVPPPSTAAVPAAPKAAARPAEPAPRPAPAAPAKPAAPVKPAVSAPASKKAYRDFWVQAGSFSTRERADGVKSTLDTKGIAAVITNQDINGSTYYRVRVGPYTSQNEADYWLAMIKSIDGFQNSQVWESQSYR